MKSDNNEEEKDLWTSNIWGWKWSMVALAVIIFFLGIAVCRYLVIQPERLIIPQETEQQI
jgi:hypothetical protein